MFGREKTQTRQGASTAPPPLVKATGKGRATPSRREAEQRNRKPLIGAPPPPKGATREERKAARQVQTERNREFRAKQRAAMMGTGDARDLPVRDQGPARRYVRDYVDARRNLGEFFLPVALVCVVLGMINLRITQLGSLVTLYALVIAIIVSSLLLRRKVIKLVTAKFGADQASGVGSYAIMRSLQIRRSRRPLPQVQRGQFPK